MVTMTDQPTGTVEEWIHYLTHDRNSSPNTIRRYGRVLAQIPDPLTADAADLQAWWDSHLDKSAATRAGDLSAVRAYYRWTARRGLRTDDPSRALEAPKVRNAYPRLIGQADMARILTHATDDRPDLRRAIALGLYGGMRIHEAAKARWSDVDLEQRLVYIVGKGGWERVIPASVRLLDLTLPAVEGGNIVTSGSRGMSVDALGRACNRIIQSVAPGHSFHDLRKRGASLMLSQGVSMTSVRRFFGWRSLATVEHYAVVSDDELRNAAELI